MSFTNVRDKLKEHISKMLSDVDHLFVVDIDKDAFNNLYLDSFPPGTNNVFRERREHDCSSCRHFIKSFGNVVKIKNGQMETIWDFDVGDPAYQPVFDAMSRFLHEKPVTDVFVTDNRTFGVDRNHEESDGKITTWTHFHYELPQKFVTRKGSQTLDTIKGRMRDTRNVFKRSLEELSEDSVLTVLELTAQKSLYKGEEWVPALKKFLEYHHDYSWIRDMAPTGKPGYETLRMPDDWLWEQSVTVGDVVGKIRNHSIGTLLQDITNGKDLNEAVTAYEKMVAPENYKRPKAIYTQKMVEQAQKQITELGYLDSLPRRFATLDDITVNNILFANRDASKRIEGSVFDQMKDGLGVNPKSFDRIESIGIETFLKDVLPKTKNVELLFDGKFGRNLMSLIAPQNKDAKSMFKWNNNFSWAYNGNVTDAMKDRVKAAGGRVDGVLRFSIQWNESGKNMNDFDAWCKQPDGDEIGFPEKTNHRSKGELDVDVLQPSANPRCNFGRGAIGLEDNGQGSKIAVENITWPDTNCMPEGTYRFFVICYSNLGGLDGFRAEIEFDNQIFHFDYPKAMRTGENITVAEINFSRKTGFSIVSSLDATSQFASREIWGVKTNQFIPVSVIMMSPNYWDDQQGIGNKHYFFMLKDCANPETPNGFFNEYLNNQLMEHKRVFEALGSMMRVAGAKDQLSGVGFSSTQRNAVILKLDGQTSRTLKVEF
jgi:hypothetical protein